MCRQAGWNFPFLSPLELTNIVTLASIMATYGIWPLSTGFFYWQPLTGLHIVLGSEKFSQGVRDFVYVPAISFSDIVTRILNFNPSLAVHSISRMATTSEVFRPSDGDLLIRDSLSQGVPVPTDQFRKEQDRRPHTQGGYRFGQLSHNSFFTRHNPHPGRVRHLKGLLDVPICSVNDDGYFANPRYSLQFPPNSYDGTKVKNWRGRIPVNAINVNSQLHPINTVTGLQYFMGLNSYPFREKAIPKVGLVPVTEAWRDELKTFTRALGLGEEEQPGQVNSAPPNDILQAPPRSPRKDEETRPRSTMYSPETGRLIPPPSRAMSRGVSRRGARGAQIGGPQQPWASGNLQHISTDPDLENMVLVMLCQILQTEDVNAVQAWLCSAGEREKGHVMGLVKSAIAGREEYYKQYPAEFIPDNGKTKLPPINSNTSGETNRLVLDNEETTLEQDARKWQKAWIPPKDDAAEKCDAEPQRTLVDDKDVSLQPPVNDVFKPAPPMTKKPLTPLQPARASAVAQQMSARADKPASPEPRLKYTKTPLKDNMWSQNQSVNTF
ncbi:protein spatial [Plakobranchus ocellatus]|uniref:Protein spatial n=1 Tax=Plakobranchus ocellatus TaxID=259542 RepID=A0AAV4BXJ3_9GAST|nr:protein spatial [Plakobranchus ocellatus]